MHAACSGPPHRPVDRGALFEADLQRTFRQVGLTDCRLTLAHERVSIDGMVREIKHIKIVVPSVSRLESVAQAVEGAVNRQGLSFKRWSAPRKWKGYVLYEVSEGRQRISSVLILLAAQALPGGVNTIPPEEIESPKIDLPKFFHGDYKIAIIIDDLGGDWSAAEALAKFHQDVTFSIIPELKFSRETAELAKSSGKEVMIHLPMEPEAREGLTIGPKTILTSMSPPEVESIFNEVVASVPFAVGMNNHMGSKITPNRALMMEILTLAKLHNLYFIDSRTTPATQAFAVARELGVPTNFRSVFLDDKAEVGYTERQLDVLLKRMLQRGSAIAIGHPFQSTLEALRRRLPEFERRGVKIVFASQLVS